VLIKLELKSEPEKVTRPSPPVSEELAAAKAAWEAVHASAQPPAQKQAGDAVGGEAQRAEQEEEEAFENALTDEQPREVGRDPPDPRRPVPRGGVRGAEGSRGGEGRRRQGAGEGGGGRWGAGERRGG
jgi:hypothetical protein